MRKSKVAFCQSFTDHREQRVSDFTFQLSRSYSGVVGCGLRCAYAARMIKLLCGSDF